MKIGDWVRRRKGKWHLVESVVAEDAITRCGRRMDRVTYAGWYGELQVSDVMPLTRMIGQPQNCKQCDRVVERAREDQRLNGMPEDDGSTQPELVP